MKIFNVSSQFKGNQDQAFKKEYINQLSNQIDSLYKYTHYYNPEWRLLGSNEQEEPYLKIFKYYNINNTEITKDNIAEDMFLDITKLNFKWGYKNSFSQPISYANSQSLNIGASIYKKDAYDVSDTDEDLLSHFIVFESSLAQYYSWTAASELVDGVFKLVYHYHLVNELEYGLSYYIQLLKYLPRYFYNNPSKTESQEYKEYQDYQIKYTNSPFDTDRIYDYNNININIANETQNVEENANHNRYQLWRGVTGLFTDTMYKQNVDSVDIYEDVIADTLLYEYIGSRSEFQVRFDKTSQEAKPIESDMIVIVS